MDDYLIELGNRPASAAMQKDVVALLNAGSGHDEYKEWLTQNEATVAQIALISYLVNGSNEPFFCICVSKDARS